MVTWMSYWLVSRCGVGAVLIVCEASPEQLGVETLFFIALTPHGSHFEYQVTYFRKGSPWVMMKLLPLLKLMFVIKGLLFKTYMLNNKLKQYVLLLLLFPFRECIPFTPT